MRAHAGWYCVGCEEYKQDDEIDKQHNCPVHQKPCIHREEENFFFKLSNYQQQLEVRIWGTSWLQVKVNLALTARACNYSMQHLASMQMTGPARSTCLV